MLASMREIPMRFATVAAAICLCLLLPAAPTPAPAAAPIPTPIPTPAPAAAAPPGDAAAKHAKRTACLKDAKTKKLVGADKTSFLKNCIGAP
jgi:hypothetical protein